MVRVRRLIYFIAHVPTRHFIQFLKKNIKIFLLIMLLSYSLSNNCVGSTMTYMVFLFFLRLYIIHLQRIKTYPHMTYCYYTYMWSIRMILRPACVYPCSRLHHHSHSFLTALKSYCISPTFSTKSINNPYVFRNKSILPGMVEGITISKLFPISQSGYFLTQLFKRDFTVRLSPRCS